MLKEKCPGTDAEREERQKTRRLEMDACSKALAVLSSDDAHDLFTKTFNLACCRFPCTQIFETKLEKNHKEFDKVADEAEHTLRQDSKAGHGGVRVSRVDFCW